MTASALFAQEWYDPAWTRRQQIDISPDVTDGFLFDFPFLVYVDDTPANPLFTTAQSDADDILFTEDDGVTKIPHEIEYYEDTGTRELYAWVRIPRVDPSVTTTIYLYYGNAAASDQQEPTAVWDDDFVLVMHLDEEVVDNETTGIHYDSTANGANGTQFENEFESHLTGNTKIAGAQRFNPNDGTGEDYINVDNIDSDDWTEYTLSAWFYSENYAGDPRIIAKSETTDPNTHIFSMTQAGGGATAQLRTRISLEGGDGDASSHQSAVVDLNTGTWYYGSIVFEGVVTDNIVLRRAAAGTAAAGDPLAEVVRNPADDGTGPTLEDAIASQNVVIGNATVGDVRGHEGIIDEVRISRVVRNQDWLEAEFRSQDTPEAYRTIGAEEQFVRGTVYEDRGLTPSGAGIPVALTINGGAPFTATTDSSGRYSIAVPSGFLSAGDRLLLYHNDDDAVGVGDGAVYTESDGANIDGLDLYRNAVTIRSQTATVPDVADLDIAANADGDIPFSAVGSLVVSDGFDLVIPAGESFQPGAAVQVGTSSASELVVDGTLTMDAGVTVGGRVRGAGTVAVAGQTLDAGGSVDVATLTSGAGSVLVGGSWSVSSFTPGSGTVTFTGTGTIPAETFANLAINSAGIVTATGSLTVTGGATFAGGGTFAPGPYAHAFAGNWNDSAIVFAPTSGTITLTSAATITQGAGNGFHRLTLPAGGTLASDITVADEIVIDGGTLSGAGFTINVAGDWTNTVGASGYAPGAGGTVRFFDALQTSTLAGETTFGNLTVDGLGASDRGKGVRFPSGSVQTVNGTLDMRGETYGIDDIAYVAISSTAPGAQASIDALGTVNVSYGTFQDINAVTAITVTNSVDIDNNSGITFNTPPSITRWTGTTSTDFNLASNWTGGVPGGTETAIIPGDAVRMPVVDADFNASSVTIVVGSGATLDVVDFILDIENIENFGTVRQQQGGFVDPGTVNIDADSGTWEYYGPSGLVRTTAPYDAYHNLKVSGFGSSFTFSGPLDVTNDIRADLASLSSSSGADATVGGDVVFTGGGTFGGGTGTHTISGSLTGSGQFRNESATTTVGGDVTVSSVTSGAGTMTVAGDWTPGGYNLTAGTVIFSAGGTVASGTFNNLTVAAGSRTATGSITVNGDLVVDGVLDMGAHNLVVSGTVSGSGTLVSGSGTVTVGGMTVNEYVDATGTTIVTGTWNVATFDPGLGTVRFTGASGSLARPTQFYNLTIAAGATLANGDNAIYVANLFNNEGVLVREGSAVVDRTDVDSGTVRYVANVGVQTYSGVDYHNLEIGDGVTTITAFLNGAVSVANDVTIRTNATLNGSTWSLTVGGDWTNSGTYSAFLSTVFFDDATQESLITGQTTFRNLTVTTPGKTLRFGTGAANQTTLSGVLTLTGTPDLPVVLRSVSPGTNYLITPSATFTVRNIDVQDADLQGTVAVTANQSRDSGNNDTTTASFNGTTDAARWIFAGAIYVWDGSDNSNWNTGPNWDLGSPPGSADSVVIPAASQYTNALTNLQSDRQVADFTIQETGVVTIGSFRLDITGTFSNDGTLRRHGTTDSVDKRVTKTDTDSGTVVYYAGGNTGVQDYGSVDYHNVEFDGATFVPDRNLSVAGSLTVTGTGGLNAGTNAVSLTISDDFQNSGAFTAGGPTFLVDPSQVTVISGSNDFNGLTITTPGKTVEFTDGTTTRITPGNDLIVQGTSSDYVTLRGTGTAGWTIDDDGGEDVDFARVAYSTATTGITAVSSIDLTPGQNVNWTFTPGPDYFIWDGGAGTNFWDDGNNWNPNAPAGGPTTDDTAVIRDGDSVIVDFASLTVENIFIEAGGQLDIRDNAVTVAGELSNEGTLIRRGGSSMNQIDLDSGLVQYSTTGGAIQEYGGTDYFNLRIDGQPFTLVNDLSVGGTLTINGAGSLSAGTYDVTSTGLISGTGTLVAGTGNVTASAGLTVATFTGSASVTDVTGVFSPTTFTPNGGTVRLSGTDSLGGLTFDGLTIASGTRSLNAAVAINQDLLFAGGTLDAGAEQLTVGGDWVGGAGTFSAGTGEVIFANALQASTVTGATTFNNLTIATPGKTVLFESGALQTVGGLFSVQGTSGGLVVLDATGAGDWLLANTGTNDVDYADVDQSDASGGILIDAINSLDRGTNTNWNFIRPTTYTWNGSVSSDWGTAANWTPSYVADGTPGAPVAGPGDDAGDVVIVPAGTTFSPTLPAATFTLDSLTIEAGATVTSQATTQLTLTTAISNEGTLIRQGGAGESISRRDANSGVVVYVGSGAIQDYGPTDYHHLEVDAAGTMTLGAPLTVADSLVVTGGTLDLAGNSVTVPPAAGITIQDTGTLTHAAGTILLGGDWTNARGLAGYAATGTATVDLTDAGSVTTISGSTRFGSLTSTAAGKTVRYAAGETQVVTTTFNIQGASGNEIVLESTVSGSLWYLDVDSATTTTIDYVAVSDSDLLGATPVLAPLSSATDGGNNDTFDSTSDPGTFGNDDAFWTFIPLFSWTGAIDTDWDTPGNWSPASVPGSGAIVTIQNVANQPVKAAGSGAITLASLTMDPGTTLSLEDNSLTVSGTGNYTAAADSTLRLWGAAAQTVTLDTAPITIPGIVEYNGDGSQGPVTGLAAGGSYTILRFRDNPAPAGPRVFRLGAPLTVTDELTIDTDYTLDLNGNAFTAGGSMAFTNDGTLELQGGEAITNPARLQVGAGGAIPGTVVYTGDEDGAADVFASLNTDLGSVYTELVFRSTDGAGNEDAWNVGADVTVSGTLDVVSGGAMAFTGAGSSIPRVQAASAASLSVRTVGALDFVGPVTVAGGLTANTGGAITQSADLTVPGTAALSSAGTSITIDRAGNDFGTVTVSGGGTVTVRDANSIDLGAHSGPVSALDVTAAGAVTDSGAIVVSGTTTIDPGANSVTLDTAGNDFATLVLASATDATIVDQNGIVLGSAALTGALTLTAGGNVTDSGQLQIAGTTTINAGTGSITLDDDGDTDTYGTLVLTASNATIVEDAAMVFGAVTLTGSGDFTAAGAITQAAGTLDIDGSASFAAGANAITLTAAGNDFTGAVALSNSGANNVALTDANALVLGTSTVGTGTLTVNAGGAITQAGATTVTQAAGAGVASFTAGANAITLDNANEFTGAVALSNSGANNVVVVDATGLILGTIATGTGTFDATAGGAITQAAAATIGGDATFRAPDAADITLDNTGNNFGGSVQFIATGGGTPVLANVTVYDTTALDILGATVSGTLAATSEVSLAQSGAIGGGTLIAVTRNDAGAPITLTDAGNDFDTVSLRALEALPSTAYAAGGIQYTDSNGFDFGSAPTGTTSVLSIGAGGDVTDSQTLSVGGNTVLNNPTADFVLDDAANAFGNLQITAVNATVVEDAAMTFGAVTLTGNGDFTAAGAITQAAGTLDIDGSASFAAGANAITLTAAGNDFTGAVALSNSGANNVALTDANALVLGTSTVGTGTLTVNAGGAITQAGATTVTQAAGAGVASFTAGANAITLDNANEFTGAVALSNSGANNVVVVDATGLILGTIATGTGTFDATAGGAITQAAAAAIGGDATFRAPDAADITLDNTGNNFGGSVQFIATGGGTPVLANVTVYDTTALDILGATVSGTLAATSEVSLTQSGAIGGGTLIAVTRNDAGAPITLTDAGNDFDTVSLRALEALPSSAYAAGTIAYRDADGFDLGAAATGTTDALTLTPGGALTDSESTEVSGTTTLTNAGAPVTLDTATNTFGTLVITASNATIVEDAAMTFGAVTLTGNGDFTAAGAITQAAGTLDIDGSSSFAAGANAITLTAAGNDFTGAVALSNSGANNVALTDANALELGTATVGTGTLTVNAGGPITQAGATTVTQAAGAGVASFTAGANAITLDNANEFTGAVALSNSGANDVALTDATGLTLGVVNVGSGTLTVTAGGPITQGATVVQEAGAGVASFTAGANAITLTAAGNDFTGAVALSNSGANNVALTDANALELGTSTVGTGTLTVNAGGAITQAGVTTVTQAAGAGVASFAAGANAITLDNANEFTGAVALSNSGANDVALTDATGLILGASSVGSGSLTVTAGSGVTQSGALTQEAGAGLVDVDAGAGVISLTDGGNSLTGLVDLANTGANAAAITTASTLRLRTATVGENFSATAPLVELHDRIVGGGTIALNGAIELHVDALLDSSAGDGTITLNGALDDDAAVALRTLTMTAGTGSIFFDGGIGTTRAPGSLDLSAGGYEFRGNATGADDIRTDGAIALANPLAPPAFPLVRMTMDSAATLERLDGAAIVWPFDLYVDLRAGGSLTVENDLTLGGKLVLFDGALDLNGAADGGNTFTIADDFAVVGANYSADDPDFDGDGDAVLAEVDDGRFGYPDAAELLYDPGAYGTSIALGEIDGSSFVVGGDLYVNGADLRGNATHWTLVLPDATGAEPTYNPAAPPADPIAWGSPYAVAFNMAVSYVDTTATSGSAGVAAAVASAGQTNNGVTDAGNNDTLTPGDGTVWGFAAPAVENAWSLYDDYVSVDFTQPLWNSTTGNQIVSAVATGTLGVNAGTLVPFASAAVDLDGDRALPLTLDSPAGHGDLGDEDAGTFSLLLRSSQSWNTDATGLSPGDPASTDEQNQNRAITTDLVIPKGAFFAADSRNLVVNYGANTFGSFTATEDRARPALVQVVAGRDDHEELDAGPFVEYDGHNFFELRYSEPVVIGGLIGTDRNIRAQETFSSGLEHGGFIRDDGSGTVNVEGYFAYPGTFAGGTTDADPAPSPAASALYRTNEPDFNDNDTHYLTIVAKGWYDSVERWVGYIDEATDPASPAQTVTVPANPFITDASPALNTVLAGGLVRYPRQIEPGTAHGVEAWDVDPPDLAPFRPYDTNSDYHEIVALSLVGDVQLADRLELHFLDDRSDAATWESTPTPRTEGGDGGVRDYRFETALENGAFRLDFEGSSPADPLPGAQVSFDTDIVGLPANAFFDDVGGQETDDMYVAITLDDESFFSFPVTQSLWMFYETSGGPTGAQNVITDHAGNRMASFSERVTIERVPPRIATALAIAGGNRIYLRFSEWVYGTNGSELTDPAVDINTYLRIVDRDGNPVGPADGLNAPPNQFLPAFQPEQTLFRDAAGKTVVLDGFVELASGVITPGGALDWRVEMTGTDFLEDEFTTPMSPAEESRVTDIALNVIQPTAAWNDLQRAPDDLTLGGSFAGLVAANEFDGSGELLAGRDTTIQATILDAVNDDRPTELYYDVDVPDRYLTPADAPEAPNRYWLPVDSELTDDPDTPEAEVVRRNVEARAVLPSAVDGTAREYEIPASDPEIEPGAELELVLTIDGIPAASYTDPTDPRSVIPWSLSLTQFVRQRGGVTILNNVIYPENGDSTVVEYEVERAGMVMVSVFSVDGALVRSLARGRVNEGSQRVAWDGRNANGRIVASGLYFIRVVAPGIDEIRKVLVAKE